MSTCWVWCNDELRPISAISSWYFRNALRTHVASLVGNTTCLPVQDVKECSHVLSKLGGHYGATFRSPNRSAFFFKISYCENSKIYKSHLNEMSNYYFKQYFSFVLKPHIFSDSDDWWNVTVWIKKTLFQWHILYKQHQN